MATSAGQLIDECLGLLQSFTLDEAQSTTLAADVSSTDLAFTVTSTRGVATGISPGILEIDQELVYCDTVDSAGNATIPAWGRGVQGTAKAAHVAGSRIISQPTFPRYWVLQNLNETIARAYPEIFAVRSYEATTTFPSITYSLPSDAERVLRAAWQVPDGRNYWQTVRRMRMSPGGGTLTGDTARSVDIGDAMQSGRPIQFLYAAQPTPLVNETDDFESTTGLHAGMKDVIYTGAAAALTISQELSRLQVSSVEQQNRSGLVAPSAALTSSSLLDRRFQTRLLEERKSLQRLYPPRLTGVWS